MSNIKYLFVLLLANQALGSLLNVDLLGKLCFFCQDFTFVFGSPNTLESKEVFSKTDKILPFQTTTKVSIPVPQDDIVGITVTVRAVFSPTVTFDLATSTVTITYSRLTPATSVYHISAFAEPSAKPLTY